MDKDKELCYKAYMSRTTEEEFRSIHKKDPRAEFEKWWLKNQYLNHFYFFIPNGIYDATWSGFEMEIHIPGNTHSFNFQTTIGVKCMNCKVKVEVTDGWVTEFTEEK